MAFFDRFKRKTQQTKVVEKNPTDELREKLFGYVNKYYKDSLTRQELKDFCKLMVEYCKQTRHADATLPAPNVTFKILGDEFTNGYYLKMKNDIVINETYLDKILNKSKLLSNLIDTIGHEMTHYHQNSNMIEYDNASIEMQHATDEKIRSSIDSYKNYFYLDKEEVKALHDLLAPYLKEDEIPSGYTNIEDFYKDISFSSYYTIQVEKEAREEGVSFALDFYQRLEKFISKKMGKKFFNAKLYNDKISLEISQKYNVISYGMRKKTIDEFSSIYNLDTDQILKIVERVESKNASLRDINNTNYEIALRFLIKNKTMEQKKSLLKNFIYNGFNRVTSVITELMENDLDFKSNKEEISTFVSDCITGKAYDGPDFKVNHCICFVDYSKLLTQNDFEKVIKKVVRDNAYDAKRLITFSSNIKTFSLESLLECQKHTFKNERSGNSSLDDFNLNSGFGSRCEKLFYEALFTQVKIADKIEYLKSGKLKPEVYDILTKCIKNDARYDLFEDEIEQIISNQANQEIIQDNYSASTKSTDKIQKRLEIDSQNVFNLDGIER